MRKLMWFSLGFAGACAVGAWLYRGAWLLPVGAVVLFLAAVLLLMSQRVKPIRTGAALLLGCAVGCVYFLGFKTIYLDPATALDGQTVPLTIQVSDYSWDGSYGSTVDGVITLDSKQYQVRAYLRDYCTLLPGDEIGGAFRLRLTTADGTQGATYHQGNGIFLLAYQADDITVKETDALPLRYYPAYLRLRITSLLEQCFPKDTAAFAKALLLGDSGDIDYETNTAFKVTGIRHIIAVSGLHVSILFALVYLLAGRKRVLTALVGIPVVLLFAAVAGFTPSITRACIMQVLMMLAMALKREYDPATALSFAALTMLIMNPLAITSASFQLSVGCMIGIFLFSGRISGWFSNGRRFGKSKGGRMAKHLRGWLASGISVSLSAMTVTTPLTAYYFSTVSLVSVAANLLTLWVVTFVFYGILLVCLLGLFWLAGAQFVASVVAWPIRYILAVVKLLARIPLAAVYTYSGYVLIWMLLCYVLLAVFLLGKKKRPGVLACCMVLGLCVSLLASWMEPLTDECRVTVLNVGQGQSILLQSEGKTYLVDCGGDDANDAADLTAETLLSQGITHLDGLILTHYDTDHAGGAGNLLTRIRADNILLPACPDETGTKDALLRYKGGSICLVKQDMALSYGATKLTVIPSAGEGTDNESSLCVLFQTKNCDILITGDRDADGERQLLRSHSLPDLELLIVGHHGSKYATSEELLAAAKPETAIISVGKDNHYGHPAQEVLDRLTDAGCTIYRTDLDGTVIFRG